MNAGFATSESLVFLSVLLKESNGPTDNYAAIAQVDIQRQEPESLRKWREEQKARLEALGESVHKWNNMHFYFYSHHFTILSLTLFTPRQDSASKAAEAEWKEKARKELEEWHVHQSEQMEKNKANNR